MPRALLGLRGRLTAALVFTSIVTLAVAASTLISPLEGRLRADAVRLLVAEAKGVRGAVDAALAPPASRQRLNELVRLVRRRTGAEVTIVDSRGAVAATTDPDAAGGTGEAQRAIATGRTQRAIVTADGRRVATIAVPARQSGHAAAVQLTKPLTDVESAGDVVRRALLVAGLVAAAVALLLGLLLAHRLVRRLVTLRDSALRLAELGPAAEVATDGARDEVGDLTRAFATMQSRLREQEQARRAFVSTASHELRTPLASLKLMLEAVEEDLDQPAPDVAGARGEARRAADQAQRLAVLADELLELSRIDAGLPLRRELVELGEVCRSVCAEFELRAAERRIGLDLRAPQPCWAAADPGAVARIVRILVDNAMRFAPPGSAVVVTAEGGSRPQIAVQDEGPGVAADVRDRLFERFARSRTAGADSGAGLGLAIGAELAERLGGTLTLGPESPGARFVLALEPPDPAGDA